MREILSFLDNKNEEKIQATFESPFEEEVFNKLQDNGFNVETQVGVGGY